MGIGVISLQTSQKREQSGPPFASGSANNGLSVDTVGGHIVLGNDVGAVGAPAQLLSNREIVTEDALLNLFAVILNSIQTGITTNLDGQSIQMLGAAGTSPIISLTTSANGDPQIILTSSGANGNPLVTLTTSAGGDPQLLLHTDTGGNATITAETDTNGIARLALISFPDSWEVLVDGNGQITFQTQLSAIWAVDTSNNTTQIGNTLVNSNAATLQVTGTLTSRLFTFGIGAGTTNVDRDLDSGKLFINSAAANLALPNMAAANLRAGFRLRLTIDNVAGGTITASAGQVIRFGSLVTSSGGTISSTDVGAFISIILINSGTWITESFVGAWILT